MDVLLIYILMHFRISAGLVWAWLLVWNDSWTFKLNSNSSNFMDLHFSWLKYREMIYYCYILGCFLTSQSSLLPLSSRTKQVLSRDGQEGTAKFQGLYFPNDFWVSVSIYPKIKDWRVFNSFQMQADKMKVGISFVSPIYTIWRKYFLCIRNSLPSSSISI